MTPKTLAKLAKLAALRADLAALNLYRFKAAIDRIEGEAAALGQTRSQYTPPLGEVDPIAMRLAAHGDLREVQEGARLAAALREKLEALPEARYAVAKARGQRQMLDDMEEQARKAQEKLAERRGET